MKKRLLSLALALALVCALLPTVALAAGDFQIIDGVLVSYTGPGGDVVIPNGVTNFGRMFRGYTGLTSVTIPNSVTSIDAEAFRGCKNLTSVTIGNGVTTIGENAFNGCTSLTSVTIGNGVTSIGEEAFYNCTGLTSVTIPDSVTSIRGWTFWCCSNLTSVTIGNGVTSIGREAFSYCDSLISVTIGNSVTHIGNSAFECCESLTSVTIPDSVTSIGEEAFLYCESLTSVTLGNSVTSIGKGAFYCCRSLTSATIPDSVTYIGNHAFEGCRSLTSITIPDSVTSIGEDAFNYTGLTSVTIPPSAAMGAGAFSQETTICGAEGSHAQLWAVDNGNTFQATLPPSLTPGRTAYASTQNILVNGVPVEFQAYALKDENGNATNYVKLRDVAFVLNGTSAQFEVGWNGGVTIYKGNPYTPNGSEMTTPYSGDRTYASAGSSPVSFGSWRSENMQSLLLKDADGNGYTYFKLRDLGEKLGFSVDWSAEKGIFIETK